MNLKYKEKKPQSQIRRRARELACKLPKADNFIIAGENFVALSALLSSGYSGKVDLIYIDPPFFTNNDFVVTRDRVRTISNCKSGDIAYSDKYEREEYLEFIRERLVLLYKLLSKEGSLYLHIDTKIGHYIKIILDEIFGEENFLNEITRKKGNPKNFFRRAYGNEKDTIYFYAKNKGQNIWNDERFDLTPDDEERLYAKRDQDGRAYTTVTVHAPGECDGATGQPWHMMMPPAGRHWRTSPEKLDELDRKGLIEWSSKGVPRIIRYADEHLGKKIQDIWLDFKDPAYPEYPTQKNKEMLELIVKQSSAPKSIVLDCFAGGGGTLEIAKKLGRRFIAIDQSDVSVKLLKEKLFDRKPKPKTCFVDLEEYKQTINNQENDDPTS